MIVETTYTIQENEKLINEKVGKSYTFFQSIKLNGIGSKRMIIESVSPNFSDLINEVSDINYANIELRPKGILIHINKGLRTFSWIISFYHLKMFKINGPSIHDQDHFIRFRKSESFNENKHFFDKMIDQKVKYLLNIVLKNDYVFSGHDLKIMRKCKDLFACSKKIIIT